MATKQVQSFQEYFESLNLYNVNSISSSYIISSFVLTNGTKYLGRVSLTDVLNAANRDGGVISKSDLNSFKSELKNDFVSGTYENNDNGVRRKTGFADEIFAYSNYYSNAICFPFGISLRSLKKEGKNDFSDSFIGWGTIEPSTYGDDSSTTLDCNVCNGTFGMETVYIKDLYVKNLHTADSSSSGNGDYLPKETYTDGLFAFDGIGISVDRIKNLSGCTRGVAFPNGISLCEKDITDSWIGYYPVTPSNYGFKSNTEIQANTCYGTFGMETVYMSDLYVRNLHTPDFDLKDKIKALEARIAALESKTQSEE